MPFKSQQQRKFMYARHPEMAKRWEKETPKDKLPEKVATLTDYYYKYAAFTGSVQGPGDFKGAVPLAKDQGKTTKIIKPDLPKAT